MNEDTNSDVSQEAEECDVDGTSNGGNISNEICRELEASPKPDPDHMHTGSNTHVMEVVQNPEYEDDVDTSSQDLMFVESQDLTPVDENDIIPVTCGHINGKLIKNRFHCPGINRPCIEYDGKLVTPKEFMFLGDKSRLKDWKNAIRIHGRQVRKYIDSGEIDFYRHKEVCTGRCIARIPFQQRTTVLQSAASSPSSSVLAFDVTSSQSPQVTSVAAIHELTYTQIPDHAEKQNGATTDVPAVSINGEQVDVKPDIQELNKILAIQTVAVSQAGDGNETDDMVYWRGIIEGGLIDEFFREIKSSLDRVKNNLIKFFIPKEDAEKATNVVTDLGLARKLNLRLAAHKIEVENQCKKVEAEVSDMKRQLHETEKKREMLKRRSACFEQLMDIKMTKKPKLDAEKLDLQAGDGYLKYS